MKNRRDLELIEKVITLAREERRISIEIIELLFEIEKRKAYADLGYGSLFVFCVKELKYSEAQAALRIQSMYAAKTNPEIKEKIEAGKLSLTTVSQVQTHIRNQERKTGMAMPPHEKRALFHAVENCSSKETDMHLKLLAGDELTETLVLKLTPEVKAQWEEVKNLTAHVTHGQGSEILGLLLGQWLERNRKKPETEIESESPLPVPATAAITAINPELVRQKPHRKPIENSQTPLSRAIPARVRSQVWRRDRGKCQNCGSKFGIEIDHIQPFSKNGTHDPENLRLLCKSCNLRAGVKEFGTVKMQR